MENTTYEDLIKKMNEKNTGTKTIKALGENIEVTPVLTISEYESLVNRIINLVFDEGGNYLPAMEDFAIRLFTVLSYTFVAVFASARTFA